MSCDRVIISKKSLKKIAAAATKHSLNSPLSNTQAHAPATYDL